VEQGRSWSRAEKRIFFREETIGSREASRISSEAVIVMGTIRGLARIQVDMLRLREASELLSRST
jgi:hypothetical protein